MQLFSQNICTYKKKAVPLHRQTKRKEHNNEKL